jgi:KDO2-lipid IV(A) lauroyltransferase
MAALLGRLPTRWQWRLAGIACLLGAPWLGERRRIAAINLARCFPERDAPDRRALVRRSLREAAMGVFESLAAWYASGEALRPRFDIAGLEHLRDAMVGGRGAIVLVSHQTPLELALRLLNEAAPRPVAIMKRGHNDACIEAEIDARRRAHCGLTIDKRDARGLIAALEEGRAVIIAADQDFNFQHAFLPFFGQPAATLLAVPQIAARCGASVLPLWFGRDEAGRYSLRLDPPWPQAALADAEAAMCDYHGRLEAEVRRRPAQYLWVHRRFKTRPPGEAGWYD